MFVKNNPEVGFSGEPEPRSDQYYIDAVIFYGWELVFKDDSQTDIKSYLFRKRDWSKLLCFSVEMEDRYFFIYEKQIGPQFKIKGNNFREFLESYS